MANIFLVSVESDQVLQGANIFMILFLLVLHFSSLIHGQLEAEYFSWKFSLAVCVRSKHFEIFPELNVLLNDSMNLVRESVGINSLESIRL